jgi:hypothetical protein
MRYIETESLPYISRDDEIFIKQNGKRKVFHLGSNSSCCQHICGHYKFYQTKCKELGITEHHYAIPCELLDLQSNGLKGKQMKIDGLFQKVEKKQEFSRDSVLHAVAEFIVCDDHVRFFSVL